MKQTSNSNHSILLFLMFAGCVLITQDSAAVNDIVVTMNGTVNEINAGAISITGATSGAPEATATNSNAGTAAITTAITTLTNNAWLFDTAGSGNGGTFTPGAGQTERWDTSALSATGAGSSKPVPIAGADSMSQTHSTVSNRMAHAVIAVAPEAASTIAFDAASSNNATGAASLTWTHPLPIGTDRKLIVGVEVEEPNATCLTDAVVAGVSYNGFPLTLATTVTIQTSFCQRVDIWFLDEADFQVAADIQVTLGGTVNEINAGAISITGAEAGAPEATATNSNTGSASITTLINTLSDNAWLIDTVGSGNGGSFTPGAGQTERWDSSAVSATGAASSKLVPSAGADSMSQTHSTASNRNAHAVIAVAPAAASTIAFDAASSNNATGVASLTWSHPIPSGSNLKLIVGIEVEEPNATCLTDAVVTSVSYNGIPLTLAITVTIQTTFCQRVEIWFSDAVVPSPLAYYTMDELAWVNPGDVVDSSGNGNDGDPIAVGAGTPVSTDNIDPAIAANPGTCGYGVFPLNTANNQRHAVDSTLTPGNAGAVTFWYQSDSVWTAGGRRKLLDASIDLGTAAADKYFFLTKMPGGQLRFRLEDSADTDTQAQTAVQTFAANTWVHLAITWDLANDRTEVYINGVLSVASTTNVNGSIGTSNSLYIGDNRTTGAGGNGNTGRSAGGLIDEVRVYDLVVPQSVIVADMATTHPCALLDHFDINLLTGTTASTCVSSEVQIIARDASNNKLSAYNGTVNISTQLNHGDWSKLDGGGSPSSDPAQGVLTPGGVDGGAATYTFIPGATAGQDDGDIALFLENFHAEDMTITVVDSTDPASSSTSATLMFLDNAFVLSDQGSAGLMFPGNPVAGRNHQFQIQMMRRDTVTGDCGVATSYNESDVKAWFNQDGDHPGGAAAPSAMTASETQLLPNGEPGAANLTLPFVAGVATFDLLTGDVGKYSLNFLDDSGNFAGVDIAGASTTFTVRPFSFAITNIMAGATANPGTLTPAGALFTSAGSDVSVTVGAYLWQAADDDGIPFGTANDGFPDFRNIGGITEGVNITDNGLTPSFAGDGVITSVLYFPSIAQGGTLGTLNNGAVASATFAAGQAAVPNLQYLEVGSILLLATFNNYLNTAGLNLIGESAFNGTVSNTGAVGRFGADHFDFVEVTSPQFGAACGIFTYIDQAFDFNNVPQIRARARDTIDTVVLQNYHDFTGTGGDNWWLLNLGTGVAPVYSSTAGEPANISFDTAAAGYNPTSGSGTSGEVVFSLSGPFMYDDRGSPAVLPVAPFNAQVRLDLTVTDSDTASGTHIINPITFANPVQRWGRLFVGTAFGSELLPLAVPLRAEYFDGTTFILNTDDACTDLAPTDIILNSGVEGPQTDGDIIISSGGSCPGPGNGCTQATTANNPMTSGNAGLSFSAPAAANTGFADITLDLNTLGFPHLLYDWDGDGVFDNDPAGRATFGVYKGQREFIYIREPWN